MRSQKESSNNTFLSLLVSLIAIKRIQRVDSNRITKQFTEYPKDSFRRKTAMSAFPISDIGGSWEYSHAPPTATSATGIPGFPEQSVGGLQLPFPGYTYVGASPLTQPRRHFPNSTPVLGNYAGLSSDREVIATSLNPYISKFSANAQWPISGLELHQIVVSLYVELSD